MIDTPLLFDRTLLRQRKARVAEAFSAHDFLIRYVGEDIRERLEAILRDFPVAVNIGAMNGSLGEVMSDFPRIECLFHTESCGHLLRQITGVALLADEEFLPFKMGSIDLAVSGFALQYVNDLPGVLIQIRQSLKPDGLMIIALPGARTLFELRESFVKAESEVEGGISPRVGPFADVRDCGALLQRAGFALPVTDSYEISVTYESPLALMAELRAMGATNILLQRRKIPLKRRTLFRAVEIYCQEFGLRDGRVPATFEVITLTGWAPHDSQQKPLKPGSARSKLADALGGKEYGLDGCDSDNK